MPRIPFISSFVSCFADYRNDPFMSNDRGSIWEALCFSLKSENRAPYL